ncbi:MAG: AEC family transporter [Lachnospiraceae bacterium]|nr:AEC family transporter [Lachnospiraceae bacterium]
MDSFLYSLNATVPVFAVMLVGYLLRRIGFLTEEFVSVANKFVFKVCLPCMLFLDLAQIDIRHQFDGAYIGFCAAVTIISILSIWGLAKLFLKDKTEVGAFVQTAYRSSAAILGIAFIENIYGNSGMGPLMIIGAVPLYNVFAVIILTLESNDETVRKDKSRIKTTFLNILKNPIIIGIALGMLASLIQITMPHMLEKSVQYLGNMASPLALIAIGAGFEGKKALAKIKPSLVAAFLKLIGLTAIFLPIAVWLGFRDQKLLALVIMLASPTTPTAYIMAKNMHGDDVLSSSVIVLTTFFSALTLTFWIFIMRYFGYIAG